MRNEDVGRLREARAVMLFRAFWNGYDNDPCALKFRLSVCIAFADVNSNECNDYLCEALGLQQRESE